MKKNMYTFLCKLLRFFTKIFLWRIKPVVVGITGSVGKTSCRDIIFQVLGQVQNTQKIYTSPKNYNSELGLIFSIFCIEEYAPSIRNLYIITGKIIYMSFFSTKKYDILIAEYGIDSPGDMDFLLSVMKPDIGVLTKLDYIHSDNFPGGVEQYWGDKFKLLLASRHKVYYNAQDVFSSENEHFLSIPHEKIFQKLIKTHLEKTEIGLKQKFKYSGNDISINLLGNENIEYTVLALKIAKDIGVTLHNHEYDFIFELQAGRFSIFERGRNIFIDSTYNSGPESLKKVIENTKILHKELYPNYKIIYVLGDMREIGKQKQSAHGGIANQVLDAAAIMLIGPDMYSYALPKIKENKFSGNIHSSLSSRELGKYLKKYLKDHKEENYIVLFKGSQNTIFTEEALAAQLTQREQKNLPRQSEDWKRKKDEFFSTV